MRISRRYKRPHWESWCTKAFQYFTAILRDNMLLTDQSSFSIQQICQSCHFWRRSIERNMTQNHNLKFFIGHSHSYSFGKWFLNIWCLFSLLSTFFVLRKGTAVSHQSLPIRSQHCANVLQWCLLISLGVETGMRVSDSYPCASTFNILEAVLCIFRWRLVLLFINSDGWYAF